MRNPFANRVSFIKKKETRLPSLPIAVTSGAEGHASSSIRLETITSLRNLAPRFEKAPEADLEFLVERFGDLPLLLTLAVRYLGKYPRILLQDYLVEVEKTGFVLSSSLTDWLKENPTPHALDLAAVVVITLEKLQNDPLSLRAFAAARLCEPRTVIPSMLVLKAVGCSEKQQPALDRSLDKLFQFGLLQQDPQGPLIDALLVSLPLQLSTGPESMLSNLAVAFLEWSRQTEETSAKTKS